MEKIEITPGAQAMANIAENYAEELDSQFRTLNHFVTHAGEVGRAHETFLRGMLRRFLPDTYRMGTGFVASSQQTTRQLDIIIYRREPVRLFELGDCVVIDRDAFEGAIEVKTRIGSKKQLKDALISIADLADKTNGLHALYAWDGISFETAKKAIWEFVETDPTKYVHLLPSAIYVRGKYLLVAVGDGQRHTPPFQCWRIGKNGITEGQALLGLVAAFWKFGLQRVLPWWLQTWHERMGSVKEKAEPVDWPDELRKAVMADLDGGRPKKS